MSYREMMADRFAKGEHAILRDGIASQLSNTSPGHKKSPEDSAHFAAPHLKAHEQYARQRKDLNALRKEHHDALRREMKELSDMQSHIMRKERKRFANYVAGWSENEQKTDLDVPADSDSVARDKEGSR